MAKRARTSDATVIAKWISEGKGQGKGSNYKPWLLIQNVPSLGLVTRINGWKTKRIHHLLSQLELYYFLLLDWSLLVVDIREQYPLLPIEETIGIAEEIGVRHPIHPKTQQPVVMTSDFRITTSAGFTTSEQIRTVKYSKDLESTRTLEKLEIERLYWSSREIDWAIVTEHQIPLTLVKNVKLVHNHFSLADRLSDTDFTEEKIYNICNMLISLLVEKDSSLSEIANMCDQNFELKPGTSLALVYHLIATRQLKVDMCLPIQPGKHLNISSFVLKQPESHLEDAI